MMIPDYDIIGKKSPTELLIAEGARLGVASIINTVQHPFLMKQAQDHAQYQADIEIQGHQNFSKRAAETMKEVGGGSVSEICAESWPGQADIAAARDAYECWRSSAGHWKECSRSHSFYGYGIALGKNNIWYSCGHFIDLDGTPNPEPNQHCGWLRRLLGLC